MFPVCPQKCTPQMRKGQATCRTLGSCLPVASKGQLLSPGQLEGGKGTPPIPGPGLSTTRQPGLLVQLMAKHRSCKDSTPPLGVCS